MFNQQGCVCLFVFGVGVLVICCSLLSVVVPCCSRHLPCCWALFGVLCALFVVLCTLFAILFCCITGACKINAVVIVVNCCYSFGFSTTNNNQNTVYFANTGMLFVVLCL